MKEKEEEHCLPCPPTEIGFGEGSLSATNLLATIDAHRLLLLVRGSAWGGGGGSTSPVPQGLGWDLRLQLVKKDLTSYGYSDTNPVHDMMTGQGQGLIGPPRGRADPTLSALRTVSKRYGYG